MLGFMFNYVSKRAFIFKFILSFNKIYHKADGACTYVFKIIKLSIVYQF